MKLQVQVAGENCTESWRMNVSWSDKNSLGFQAERTLLSMHKPICYVQELQLVVCLGCNHLAISGIRYNHQELKTWQRLPIGVRLQRWGGPKRQRKGKYHQGFGGGGGCGYKQTLPSAMQFPTTASHRANLTRSQLAREPRKCSFRSQLSAILKKIGGE